MRKLLRSCEAVKPFRIEFCLCIESDFANQKRNRAIRCIMRFLEVTNPICYHVKNPVNVVIFVKILLLSLKSLH